MQPRRGEYMYIRRSIYALYIPRERFRAFHDISTREFNSPTFSMAPSWVWARFPRQFETSEFEYGAHSRLHRVPTGQNNGTSMDHTGCEQMVEQPEDMRSGKALPSLGVSVFLLFQFLFFFSSPHWRNARRCYLFYFYSMKVRDLYLKIKVSRAFRLANQNFSRYWPATERFTLPRCLAVWQSRPTSGHGDRWSKWSIGTTAEHRKLLGGKNI